MMESHNLYDLKLELLTKQNDGWNIKISKWRMI